ncbi:hypothetical protein NIES4071_34810 [Calothrix sp. NIES-4071]|nr:hypothetical protein NIES4071_34810 [Calothrix sp. NIES-4071]BAZ57800.1 hypothetical protein NIES4105_34740 [Calothrix sp. NIES-4105]
MTKTPEFEEISQEYTNFLNTYQDFLKNYNHYYETVVLAKEYIETNSLTRLFEEALQARLNATNAYKKAIGAYRECLENSRVDR